VVNTSRHTGGVCLISCVRIEGITTYGNCQCACNRTANVFISSNTWRVNDICIMIRIIINLILSLRWRALLLVIQMDVLT